MFPPPSVLVLLMISASSLLVAPSSFFQTRVIEVSLYPFGRSPSGGIGSLFVIFVEGRQQLFFEVVALGVPSVADAPGQSLLFISLLESPSP